MREPTPGRAAVEARARGLKNAFEGAQARKSRKRAVAAPASTAANAAVDDKRISAGAPRAAMARRVGGPAQKSGDPTLTVGEIAERLAAIAPDISVTVQRIRHWTREQMLLPVDQLHAGTGKHRRYAADAVYDAAILHVATSAGLNISSQRHLIDSLTMARIALPKWKLARAEGRKPWLHLFIWRTSAGITQVGTHDDPKAQPEDHRGFRAADIVFTIDMNIGKLFEQVDRGRS